MTRPIRVLHLEDSPRDAEVLHERLKAAGVSADIVLVTSKEAFEAALAGEAFDLILSDYNIPGYDGMAAVQLAQVQRPDTPLIVVSGTVGEEEAVKCLHVGATDYLLKHHLERLVPAVQRAVQEAEERRRRQEAEQALRQRERRLSSIYETVADGLFYIDVEENGRYRFTSVNQAFVLTTGLDYDQVLGKRVDEVILEPSLSLVLEKYGEAIRERKVVRWEETSEYPKGKLTGEVSIAPVCDDTGRCTHLVGAVHDVTVRKQLEAQFRQAQKMESVGQLAGGIAHDFNNLLTVINGVSDLLLAQISHDDPVRTDVQEILRAGERAATLTRQLLAFSRQQILEPRVLSLNTVVRGMEGLLRRVLGEDIDLVVVPAPDLGSVKADSGQIEQVISNLAVNARDAMPRGGRLTIETQNVEIDEEDARQHGVATPPGSYVRLTLTDSGVGMDEATRARIFEPFFTTKGPGKGTGLGLSTVYGIVKQSHGFIWVYSEVGRGTSFKIYLPQVTEAAATEELRPAVGSSAGTETILLVEDNAGLRKLATRVLAPAGYTVLGAASGEEALGLLEHHEAPVHLLLSDVVMPGMNGRELAEQLAQTRPGMKVLYMSGYTSDIIVRHGVLEAEMPFLTKPFTAATLLRKVRDVLDSSG
ncbi:MAG: response regulator [Acidobacteria bacterium]|nr:response regulator [Acidobacteriota bacterium]